MKILSKGINLISNLSGSSYLLEIENLAKHHKYVVVLVDNNHQVDSLFDELNNIYIGSYINRSKLEIYSRAIPRFLKINNVSKFKLYLFKKKNSKF